MFELAKKDGIYLEYDDVKDFRESILKKVNSLPEYLQKFDIPLKICNNPSNITRIAQEIMEDASKEGVSYIELRFAPTVYSKDIKHSCKKVEAALEGIKLGRERYGIEGGLILCIMRHEDIRKANALVDIAQMYNGKGVVAIDLVGDEKSYPPKLFKSVYEKAKKMGLNITIHSGEIPEPRNVSDAINVLHAKRIGHGLFSIMDNNIIDYLRISKIPLEMCIKSNLDTGNINKLERHPAKILLDKGVKVTINTDNRTISNCTLSDEYLRFIRLGATKKDMIKVAKNGIEVAFAPKKVKSKLLKEISKFEISKEI
jgi:adenosine deaminase